MNRPGRLDPPTRARPTPGARGGKRSAGTVPGDTICALATPPGTGSIAVVRLSGPDTFAVLDRVFSGSRPSRQPSHTVRLGWLRDERDLPVDQVMLTVFRSPRSYTGEDMAEISCHGGKVIAGTVLALLRRHGCRTAEPGEFARRAILSGKLTVSQAEAVLELINAQSPAALRGALERYRGGLSRAVRVLADRLRDLCALAEHHVGFDDSGSAPDRPRGLAGGTRRLVRELDAIIEKAERDRHLQDGARVAIVGRPNVGKSSLFNRLLEEERTVVADRPGTTRDRVEATAVVNGVIVSLTDTAGLHPSPAGRLNRLAGDQTRRALERTDLVLAVFDGSEPAQEADREVLALALARPSVLVVNKQDKPGWQGPDSLLRGLAARRLNGHPRLGVSALTGANIPRLRAAISRRFGSRNPGIVALDRHLDLFRECRDALRLSLAAPCAATAAFELSSALASLGQLDAPTSETDILDRVFARFCVGK